MDAFHLHIESKSEVCMLPESAVAIAAQKAKQKKPKRLAFWTRDAKLYPLYDLCLKPQTKIPNVESL